MSLLRDVVTEDFPACVVRVGDETGKPVHELN